MKYLFVVYFHKLIDDIPLYVYETLLSVFCLVSVFIISFDGIKRGWKMVIKILLFEYSFLLYCSTVIFRDSKLERGPELMPFWSYAAIQNGVDTIIPEVVMNVVALIPIGLMMGVVFKRANWRKVLVAGAVISVSIELMQLIFRKGCCETDDVIHNTIGCVMGYGVYSIVRYIQNKAILRKI